MKTEPNLLLAAFLLSSFGAMEADGKTWKVEGVRVNLRQLATQFGGA